jgi:hypothetical protein
MRNPAVSPWRSTLTLLLPAVLLFCGLAIYLKHQERVAASGTGLTDLTAEGKPRPLAEVAQALRQAKLVTVEIQTRVNSGAQHESWRGDVSANVDAPVRLLYGVDLSRMTTARLGFSPAARAYIVRIPPPERIATEVCTEEGLKVDVGWMRLRTRSGEYYLGLARRDLYERAREMTLSPEDARIVRERTLEQVTGILRKLVGDSARVQVAYDEGAGS